jgi:hypothetical protein
MADWLLQVKLSEEGLTRYSVQDFLEGRRNTGAFRLLLDRFVPCIVRKSLFRTRLAETKKCERGVFSPSDETFLLLVIENYYLRWVEIFDKSQEEEMQYRANTREWQFKSDVKTKYTEGGIRFSEDTAEQKTGLSKGWSEEGIKRYNELFGGVVRDRKSKPKPFKRC